MQPEIAKALVEAANLLLVGMVVVFLFLSMLIGAITAIAWLNKQFPDVSLKHDNLHHHAKSSAEQGDVAVSPSIIAAISAAIHQHRRSN